MKKLSGCTRQVVWVLPVIAACLFAFAGIAAAQSGQLISADYGSGNNRVDVTSRVQAMAQNGSLKFRVTNDNLGGDPAPDQVKELRIRMRDQNGRTRDYRYQEGDSVNLSLESGGYYPDRNAYGNLRIIRARYGAGNSWADVTSTLQNLVSNNTLNIKVNDTNMGGNPAEGQSKWLEVQWESQGRRQDTRIQEGGRLNLSGDGGNYGGGGTYGGGSYGSGSSGTYSGLRIISARYGAGNKWMDVTDTLRNLATNNTLNVKVNNTNMGGDPADGETKWLEVEWESSTGRQSTRVQEGDNINLSDTGGTYSGSGSYGSSGSYGGPGSYGRFSGLRILSARYGAGNKWMDVTSMLQSLVVNNSINIKVNNTNMGGDPADERKVLEVEYESQGGRQSTRVREGDYLNLSGGSTGSSNYYSDLRIIRASYGAGTKWKDVTGTLQNLVSNNRLNVKVNNTNMGGDPNTDRQKDLQIEWEYQGRRQSSHLKEGDYINIP